MKFKHLHFVLFFLLLNGVAIAQTDSVNMTAFGGIATDRGITIAWTTLGEYNVQGFKLERSLDAIQFEEVHTIMPHTDGNGQQSYFYNDDNIFRSEIYYRITTVLSTNTVQTNIIAVGRNDLDNMPSIMVYPTITSQAVNIIKNSNEDMSGARIRVFDMTGHLMMDRAVKGDFLVETVNVSAYEAGAYVVELYKGQFAHKVKFIKQH